MYSTSGCVREKRVLNYVKMVVSARSFSLSTYQSLSCFCLNFVFRVRYFLYMSVHHIISVPPFLRKLCSFRFHPVLSFQPCRFDWTVSFVFNFFLIRFNPVRFVSTPPLFQPCRFCLKVSLHRCFLWPQHVCFFLLPYSIVFQNPRVRKQGLCKTH